MALNAEVMQCIENAPYNKPIHEIKF